MKKPRSKTSRRTTISMPPGLWAIAKKEAARQHYPDTSSYLQHLIRAAWQQQQQQKKNPPANHERRQFSELAGPPNSAAGLGAKA